MNKLHAYSKLVAMVSQDCGQISVTRIAGFAWSPCAVINI